MRFVLVNKPYSHFCFFFCLLDLHLRMAIVVFWHVYIKIYSVVSYYDLITSCLLLML